MSGFRYTVATMGCKANLTDSQTLEARLGALGGVASAPEEADVFILNTCTVTDQADKEARSLLRKSKAKLTVAAGCLATVAPESLGGLKPSGSFLVARNSGKEELAETVAKWVDGKLGPEILQGDRERWHRNIDFLPGAGQAGKSERRTRAFLKVQDGCNAFCSYCIIPQARGRSRSLSADAIVAEVRDLVEAGVKEVVLTAIHAADYEWQGLDFTGLVEKVLRDSPVPRLRLTSLDPAEIPDRLLDLMASQPRLCPHFHISLQSANSRVLQAMKRGYGAAAVEERLTAIRARLPHSFVGMDIIAGYPGETEEEFADSFTRLERLPWSRLHVFPFSSRRGTAAARLVEMGLGVPMDTIRARAARLRALSAQRMEAMLQERIGGVAEVLVEATEAEYHGRRCSQGYTRSYHKVLLPGRHRVNEFVRARLVGLAGTDAFKGEAI